MSNTAEWIQLASMLKGIKYGALASINQNEFIIAGNHGGINDKQISEWQGLCKYNMLRDEWTRFLEYPKKFRLDCPGLVCDEKRQKVYIYDCRKQMCIFDLSIAKMEIFPKFANVGPVYPCLLNVKGSIHLIGGLEANHYIWNPLDTLHVNKNKSTFQESESKLPDNVEIAQSAAIYIPSKQSILVIGAYDVNTRKNDISMIYSIESHKWQILNITLERRYCEVLLTNDEQFVIIAGGSGEESQQVDTIHILAIQNDQYILHQSSIKLPQSGPPHIALSGNDIQDRLLVNGYVRQYMIDYPQVLTDEIKKLYSIEMFHWIEFSDGTVENKHFAIPLHDILQSL